MLECHMTEDLPNSVSTQLALSQPAHVDLFLSFTVARCLRLAEAVVLRASASRNISLYNKPLR